MVSKIVDSFIQTDMLFLDLSTTFDSVSHTLLLHKLGLFDFSGQVLSAWFEDYLNDRRQRVVLENVALVSSRLLLGCLKDLY